MGFVGSTPSNLLNNKKITIYPYCDYRWFYMANEKLLYLLIGSFLGWFLGLLTLIFSGFIKRFYQTKEIKIGICNELNEVKLRIAMAVYVLSPRFTPYTKELLTWLQPFLEEYDRLYTGKKLAERNKKLLNLSDDEFKRLSDHMLEKPESSSYLKTYSLPFFESHMGSLGIFDTRFQRRLIEIRTQIFLLNEDIIRSNWSRQVMFAISSNEAINISGLCCLL